MTAAAQPQAHPFAHIAPGPYRLIGVETRKDRGADNADRAAAGEVHTTNLCGGSCDHCGTAIWNVYKFRASNGVTFKVGADCALKASDPRALGPDADYSAALAQRKLRAQINAAKRVEKAANDAAKIESAVAWIYANADALAALPHPRGFAGQTMFDNLTWMFDNAGTAGRLKAAKAAYAALGQKMPRG